MKTSIIVSIYNKKTEVIPMIDKMFFPSLLNNASKDKEVIILDNGSPLKDETKELIHKYLPILNSKFGRVVFSRSPVNLGFGGGYNLASSLAKGKYILLASDDLYFPEKSIDSLIGLLENHKNVGLIGPITGWRDSSTFQYCKQGPELKEYSKENFKKIEEFAQKIRIALKNQEFRKTKFITGFCLAFKKEAFDNVGGFDEQFLFGHLEDTDLVKKISKQYDCVIAPSDYIHHGGIEGGSLSIKQDFLKLKKSRIINSWRYIKKWGLFDFLWLQIHSVYCYYGFGTISSTVKKII